MPTVVADKHQWQQNHPSQRKWDLKCCPLASKHECLRSRSGFEPIPGATEQVAGIPGQAGKSKRSLIHRLCMWSDVKKPFTWEVKHLKRIAFIWHNKEYKQGLYAGDVGSASLLFYTFLLQHLPALSALTTTFSCPSPVMPVCCRCTQAERSVNAYARAAARGRGQIIHSHATFHSTT